MLFPPNGKLPGFLLSMSLMLSQWALCGSGSWINPAGGNWSTSTNWAGGLIADGTGANAGFSIVNLNTDATIALNGSRTVGKLGFGDSVPSHNWFLTSGSGDQLTLDQTTGLPTITVSNQTATLGVTLAGSQGFSKEGAGTLVLSGSNNYSGGTVVNAGILHISNANALQGSTSINSGTLLWLNAGGSNYPHAISGTGTLRISSGSGAAQLSGDLSGFSGLMEIAPGSAGGKVLFSNTSQAAAISSSATVKVQSAATLLLGVADTAVSFGASLELLGLGNSENLGALRIERGATWSGPVTLMANSSIGSHAAAAGIISGNIGESGGSFGFTKVGTRTLILAGENTFSGTTVHNGAGTLLLGNALALRNSTLAYTGGGLEFADSVGSHSYSFGGLSGTAGIILNDNADIPASIYLTVGGNHESTSYSGNLSGEGSFEKNGTGILTISGRHTYAGSTTISQGTLRLALPPILPANLKIMPLGDSITYGSNGTNAGYRGLLYNLLNPIAPGFQYVGTSIVNPGTLPTNPIDQRHNEGHSSYTIDDISNNLDGFDNARFLQYGGPERNPNGGYWFDGIPNVRDPIHPDVITMMIGTNDTLTLTGVQERLHNLIAKITTLRPSAKLIVAKITPLPMHSVNVSAYNAIVASEVAAFQAAGKHVHLVDMHTGFPANGLSSDQVHPNDIGFIFMANQWRNAIVSACATDEQVLPASSPVSIAAGSVLDLNGTRASIAGLSGPGAVSLGNGGELVIDVSSECTFDGSVLGTGRVTKSGAGVLDLAGALTHSGDTRVIEGTLLVKGAVTGSGMIEVLSGAVLEIEGGTLTAESIHIHAGGTLRGDGVINGEVVNDGDIIGTSGQVIAFTDRLTNKGLIRIAGGAFLHVYEDLINQGTLDFITASPVVVENLVNSGSILDSSLIRVNSLVKSAAGVTATIHSYTGHSYQLQHSSTLVPGSWQSVGEAQEGLTGNILNFQTSAGAAEPNAFYRIRVSP